MLGEIVAYKKNELKKIKKIFPFEEIKNKLLTPIPSRDFYSALKRDKPGGAIKIVAEIKKASPSHGSFESDFLKSNSIAEIASVYEDGGASAISVLTEDKYFAGSPDYLRVAKEATNLPILRKDFIIDEYQVYESKVIGADAILLIVSLLSDKKLHSFIEIATSLAMHVLVETRDADEIKSAFMAGARIVGVNNRDLKTMSVDIEKTIELSKYINGKAVFISESGINTSEQVERLKEKAGIDAILVGKSLVTSLDPRAKLAVLRGGINNA